MLIMTVTAAGVPMAARWASAMPGGFRFELAAGARCCRVVLAGSLVAVAMLARFTP